MSYLYILKVLPGLASMASETLSTRWAETLRAMGNKTQKTKSAAAKTTALFYLSFS
jgi:hypothetical protein